MKAEVFHAPGKITCEVLLIQRASVQMTGQVLHPNGELIVNG